MRRLTDGRFCVESNSEAGARLRSLPVRLRCLQFFACPRVPMSRLGFLLGLGAEWPLSYRRAKYPWTAIVVDILYLEV